MIYGRHSIDYQLNLYALHEVERIVPMTIPERFIIRSRVKKGHDIESPPWDCRDPDGCQLNNIQAFRLGSSYSYGPCDAWKGLNWEYLWDDELKCFVRYDI